MVYKSHDVLPKSVTINLDCPSEFGDLSYSVEVPVLFFSGDKGGGDLTMKNEPGTVTKKISHPIPDWETEIQADWTFEITPLDEFDFDVDVDPAIVEIIQGGTATAHINTKLTKGTAKNVKLTVTSWPTLNAFITNPTVTPTETTTLNVETTCNTVPDTYLYTVQGSTTDTFKTSTDSVSVVVKKNPTC